MLSATYAAECHIKALSAECNYAECHIKAFSADCKYDKCRYAERRGAFITAYLKVEILEKACPPLRDTQLCGQLSSSSHIIQNMKNAAINC
jgi:hypothetical protein